MVALWKKWRNKSAKLKKENKSRRLFIDCNNPCLRASLDEFTDKNDLVREIKYPFS